MQPRINAGDLDRRITIEQPTTSRLPGNGEAVNSWSPLITVWAARWQLSAKEVARAGGTGNSAELKFLIRWRAGIDTTMRVIFDGRPYEITGTEEYGRRVGLLLFVKGAV